MSYHIVHTEDVQRVVSAVIIDAKSVTMPLGVNGIEVQAYIDSQLALIYENTIVYKVEANDGNLVGYFTVQVNMGQQTGEKKQQVLRAPFIADVVSVTETISQFMQQNLWKNDYLF